MKKKNLLKKKMELFYQEINGKRKGEKMRLQTDIEFQQNEIKKLNKNNNVETSRVGKLLLQSKR